MKYFSGKIILTLATFSIGIIATSLWLTYGYPLSQKLDGFIVDTGANILGRLSRSDDSSAPPQKIISPYEAGKIEARLDIQNGKLIVKSLGELTVVHPLYKDVLMKDYGIEFIDYGCVSTPDFSQYVRAYNEVSKDAIESRYGKGFLDKIFDRAEKEYMRKNLSP